VNPEGPAVYHFARALALLTLVAQVRGEPPGRTPKANPPAKTPAHLPQGPAQTDPAEAEALARVLRDLLRQNIPDPVLRTSQNWGNQIAVTRTRRKREGFRVWNEPVQEFRNDGTWRRITVRIPEPDKTFLAVTRLTRGEDGKLSVTVGVIAERVELRLEQQIWKNGLRIYAGETRAHCRGGVLLSAEVKVQTVFKKDSWLPDVTVQVKATEARIVYEDLVVDHTAGLDGDAAKTVGELAIRAVKALKPDLERDLLTKGNEAIVKAAGTREFKASLADLFKAKK
jgi:hypothetical protein